MSGFGPLQPFLDDPTVEEVWINDPSRVFIARHGRHELTNLVLTDGAGDRAGRADAEVQRAAASTSSRRSSTRCCPRATACTSCSRASAAGFTAVNIRKFVLRAARLRDLVELGSLSPRAATFLEAIVRAGLNILVAGATQAGKTTMLNCLAAAIPGGDRVVSAEEVFELRFHHPDWVPMQTRQSGLEGTGEIRLRDLVKEALRMRPSRMIVGEVRAEECLDLLLALNAGLPGHVHAARQQRARGAGEDVHAAAAGRREHLGPVRRADRRVVGRPGGPPRHRRARRTPGQRDRRRCPGGSRTTSSRPSRSSCGTGTSCAAPHGMPPRLERYERVGIDVHRLLNDAAVGAMGVVVGLGVGVGLLLVWSAFALPRRATPSSARRAGRVERLLAQRRAGRGVGRRLRRAVPRARARSRSWWSRSSPRRRRSRWPSAVMGGLPAGRGRGRAGAAPAARARRGLARGRRQPRLRRARRAVAARRARRPRRPAAPSRCAPPSTAFALDYQVTGRFGDCLDRLKARLADPVGDRVVEGLRVAREVGGGELGRLLRNLSGYLRDDLRTRSELEARQAWAVNGARLAVAAPWLVLLLMSVQSEVIPRYRSPGGRRRPGRRRRRLRRSPTG